MPEYLSANELKRLFPTISRDVLKRSAVGGLAPAVREQDQGAALDKDAPGQQASQGRMVLCCTIIQCRHRLLDSDNSCIAAKPLRDAIARMFGIADDDKQWRWCYGQVQTRGKQGVIVKLERIYLR